MSEPLENLYFNWLCAKVINLRDSLPSSTYNTLFGTMHRTEFVWLILGDGNRAEDGKDLRTEFILQADIPDDPDWRNLIECSVFEMLIAFVRRTYDMTDIPSREWFWEFLRNLGLDEMHDASGVEPQDVAEILDRFIWRTYDKFGRNGGMFPLSHSPVDQRKQELWFQFCEYLIDQDRIPV
jgi:hypothetical protein